MQIFTFKQDLIKQLASLPDKDEPCLLIYDMEAVFYMLFDIYQADNPYEGSIVPYFDGFKRVLSKFFRKNRESHGWGTEIAVFDSYTSFRRQVNPNYKANRYEPIPYKLNLNYLGRFLRRQRMIITQAPHNYESDDLIASICEKVKEHKTKTVIITTDTDLLQLVDKNISVMLLKTKKGRLICSCHYYENFNYYGFYPEQITQLKALCGDFYNNVAPAISYKEASELIREHWTVKRVYEYINEIDDPTRTKLLNKESLVFNNLRLVTLIRNLLDT